MLNLMILYGLLWGLAASNAVHIEGDRIGIQQVGESDGHRLQRSVNFPRAYYLDAAVPSGSNAIIPTALGGIAPGKAKIPLLDISVIL